MSAGLALEQARLIADGLERREQQRHGGSRHDARTRLARHLGWSPGTLYNLARERLKKIDRDLCDQLTDFAIRDLEHEIARLSAEIEAARALGVAPHPDRSRRLKAVLDRASALHLAMVEQSDE